MADTSNLEFGRVLESGSTDRKVWFLVIPAVLALGALLIFAGSALSKAGGLESKVRVAEQQVQEANKAVEERDKLLQKARADEAVLRSAGQGAAIMAAAEPGSPASGVALVHPEQKAVNLFVFGLKQPEAGREYRVEAIGADKQHTVLGTVIPDNRGTAFLLAKDVPEGASGIEVVLATASPEGKANDRGNASSPSGGEGTSLVLAGDFPKPGTAGVVQPPDLTDRVQARTPKRATRRPLR